MAVELPSTPSVSDNVSISGFFTKVLNSLTWLSLLYQPLHLQDSIAPLSDVTAGPIDIVESSGAAPNPVWYRLSLDAAADEGRQWDFILDRRYVGSPVLKIHYYMAGANTSKSVCVVCQIAAVSDTDASVTAKTFDAVNFAVTVVPDAAGTEDVASITLTNNNSMAAGDRVSLLFYRDADGTSGTDDAAGDCVVTGVELQFLPY